MFLKWVLLSITEMKLMGITTVLKTTLQKHYSLATPNVLVPYSKLVVSVPLVQQMTHHSFLLSEIGYKIQMKEYVGKRKKG